MTQASFDVPEIVCEGCATSIKKALGDLAGVASVDVDVAGKQVRVQFDETSTSAEAVRERIEVAGFDVAVVSPSSD